METIIQVSIGGAKFSLTDSAHKTLEKYLNEIHSQFNGKDAGEEIVKDIESRISELLAETPLVGGAVSKVSVETIISRIGTAKEITGEEGSIAMGEVPSPEAEEKKVRGKRRLYRDKDNAILGGVSAGIAKYFDIDVTFIRIAFILATFLSGPAIPFIYIILWIIVPPALTASDRLEMEGEPVNIDTIAAKVRSEVNELRTNGDEIKGRIKSEFHRGKRVIQEEIRETKIASKVRSSFGPIAHNIARIIKSIFAFILASTGAVILISICAGIGVFLATTAPTLHLPITALLLIAAISAFLSIAIPAIIFMFVGFSVIFKRTSLIARPVVAMLVIWILAIASTVLTAPTVIARTENSPEWQNDPDLKNTHIELFDGSMENNDPTPPTPPDFQ